MNEANDVLLYIAKWFQINKLSLNIEKSNYIVFKNKNKRYLKEDAKLFIDDGEINQVAVTKFLGVFVDEKLSWKKQIMCVQIMKSLGIIRKVCSLVNQSCLLTIYYSLYPYISYCNIVWARNYPSSLQKIVLIQKKVC